MVLVGSPMDGAHATSRTQSLCASSFCSSFHWPSSSSLTEERVEWAPPSGQKGGRERGRETERGRKGRMEGAGGRGRTRVAGLCWTNDQSQPVMTRAFWVREETRTGQDAPSEAVGLGEWTHVSLPQLDEVVTAAGSELLDVAGFLPRWLVDEAPRHHRWRPAHSIAANLRGEGTSYEDTGGNATMAGTRDPNSAKHIEETCGLTRGLQEWSDLDSHGQLTALL